MIEIEYRLWELLLFDHWELTEVGLWELNNKLWHIGTLLTSNDIIRQFIVDFWFCNFPRIIVIIYDDDDRFSVSKNLFDRNNLIVIHFLPVYPCGEHLNLAECVKEQSQNEYWNIPVFMCSVASPYLDVATCRYIRKCDSREDHNRSVTLSKCSRVPDTTAKLQGAAVSNEYVYTIGTYILI